MDSRLLQPSGGERENATQPVQKLFFESNRIRRSIIASYWIVILLALPLWWRTTSIERLSLPSSRVLAQAESELQFPVRVALDASADDAASLQRLLLEHSQQAPTRWKSLDVEVTAKQHDDPLDSPGIYTVISGNSETLVQDRTLYSNNGDSLSQIADILSDLIAPYPSLPDFQVREHRVAPYAQRYRLAFTLLNEDAAAGKAILGWDVRGGISRYISPILDGLSVLHNFTIESQVQFHAPLAFKPRPLENQDAYGVTPEDLTVFVNSAEWTLCDDFRTFPSSVSSDPVLHFILFVPSASQRPLHILDVHGTPSPSTAFLLPQWGGIFIFNPPPEPETHIEFLSPPHLDFAFSAFANQLLTLLGVPRLPSGVRHSVDSSSSSLTNWQLDALLRRRAFENARGSQETLLSIVKLVQQIENMPVGQYVKGDVQDALTALDKLYAVASSSPTLALHYSSLALSLASRAFFNPGMLALLYFPVEHKYAVYSPLFASAMVPLFAAAVRELLAWRRAKREEAKVKTE